MPIAPPFNFNKWIEEHKHLLKPPVGATLVFQESGNFIVMVVGGPNRRNDYHLNQSDEIFWQLKGDMVLKIVDNGEFKDISIKEGEMFLLPGNTPHSPQRFEDTIGLVIEQKRNDSMTDGLRWYCEKCNEILYEEKFQVKTMDLGGALKPIIEDFYADEKKRTCKKCGHVTPPPPEKQKQ